MKAFLHFSFVILTIIGFSTTSCWKKGDPPQPNYGPNDSNSQGGGDAPISTSDNPDYKFSSGGGSQPNNIGGRISCVTPGNCAGTKCDGGLYGNCAPSPCVPIDPNCRTFTIPTDEKIESLVSAHLENLKSLGYIRDQSDYENTKKIAREILKGKNGDHISK